MENMQEKTSPFMLENWAIFAWTGRRADAQGPEDGRRGCVFRAISREFSVIFCAFSAHFVAWFSVKEPFLGISRWILGAFAANFRSFFEADFRWKLNGVELFIRLWDKMPFEELTEYHAWWVLIVNIETHSFSTFFSAHFQHSYPRFQHFVHSFSTFILKMSLFFCVNLEVLT